MAKPRAKRAPKILHDFGDGNGPVPAKVHSNKNKIPGGIVALTATIDSTTFVGPGTEVYGTAKLSRCILEDGARVGGTASLSGTYLAGNDIHITQGNYYQGFIQTPTEVYDFGEGLVPAKRHWNGKKGMGAWVSEPAPSYFGYTHPTARISGDVVFGYGRNDLIGAHTTLKGNLKLHGFSATRSYVSGEVQFTECRLLGCTIQGTGLKFDQAKLENVIVTANNMHFAQIRDSSSGHYQGLYRPITLANLHICGTIP